MKVLIDSIEYAKAKPRAKERGLGAALDVTLSGEFEDMTVRDYLRKLLLAVWEENESFDGKRPFGNSGWDFDLIVPLADAGFVELGIVDPADNERYGWTDEQVTTASAYVSDLILEMCSEHRPEKKHSGEEGARLFATIFNLLTFEQKDSVPHDIADRISKYMHANGYRFVFNRWYLQASPTII